jgi:UDP:flavonoid glycosyltransferase YjiC (YdhE family)
VFVGLGRAAEPRLTAVLAEAVRATGRRAVLLGPADVDPSRFGDAIAVPEVPWRWLVPRSAAVVHRATAGTTAAVLRAGVPSVPVSDGPGGPLWAQRLLALGAAPDVLPLRRLTAPRLAAAIDAAVRDPRYGRAARLLADRVRRDDGAAAVVSATEGLLRAV